MAKERAWMTRNTGTAEAPVWEKYFPKTVVDAIYASDADGETKKIMDLVNERIQSVVGSAPEAFDTLQEVAAYIKEHEEVASALQAAVGNKVDKVEGKGLSTNDYTTIEKNKLAEVAEQATKNDTLYKNQVPSTVALGGIPKGYVPPASGVEAIDMIDKLLHAYVAPVVTASASPKNGGTFEAGTSQSVTAVTVNITMGSAEIKKIEVFDGSTSIGSLASGIVAGANTVTLTNPLAVSSNKQLSVTVTDNEDKTVTAKTGSFTFVSPYYYGAIAADATPTAALVKAATKLVQAKGNRTLAYTCDNQKMLFAYPKSYGALKKILDANSFDVTGTFTRAEVTVDGVAYYAYTNDASTVSAFNMTFNY